MGFERVERRGGDPSRVGTAAALVAVIAAIVGGTAFGGSLRGQQRADLEFDGFETGTALTIAQVCFGVVLAALLTIAGCWWSAGRRRADVVAWAACWCALIGGGTALAMTAGRDAGLLDSPQAIVVWLATLVPAAMLVTFLVLALRGPGHFRTLDRSDPARAARLAAELPAQQLEELTRSRARAIARLHERGLIDQAQARALGELPMGASVTL